MWIKTHTGAWVNLDRAGWLGKRDMKIGEASQPWGVATDAHILGVYASAREADEALAELMNYLTSGNLICSMKQRGER